MAKAIDIAGELAQIARANDGVLQPEAVVEFAKNKKTALHNRFTWDDGEAAKQYRIWQARMVINTTVTIIDQANEPVQAWVSLPDDRTKGGGGYRALVTVLSDESGRRALLAEAMRVLTGAQAKYSRLAELAPVFEALDGVRKKRGRRRKAS
jgi:hypothetical protein